MKIHIPKQERKVKTKSIIRHLLYTKEITTVSLPSTACFVFLVQTMWDPGYCNRSLRRIAKVTAKSRRPTDRLTDWLKDFPCVRWCVSQARNHNCLSLKTTAITLLYYVCDSLFLLFHTTVLSIEYVCLCEKVWPSVSWLHSKGFDFSFNKSTKSNTCSKIFLQIRRMNIPEKNFETSIRSSEKVVFESSPLENNTEFVVNKWKALAYKELSLFSCGISLLTFIHKLCLEA